jgi:DNA-binding SARP family transcriptional activator
VRVTLLGPVTAEVDGAAVALGGRRQRAVFGLLALNVGRVVSLDHLVRVLWEDDPPAQATMALQSLVSRLRRVLGDLEQGGEAPRILTRPPGWVLDLEADAVDTTRFRAGIVEGRRLLAEGEPAAAAGVLREALALWSGPASDELEIARFAPEEAVELEQARLDASEVLFTADLASGGTQLVVEGARRFVTENPFRERAWMSLGLALYRSGRQADALATIAELRTALTEGLGLDPSGEVLALERQILRQDPVLDAAPSTAAATWLAPSDQGAGSDGGDGRRTPHQDAAPAITGRTEAFAVLDEVLAQASRGRGRVVVVEGSAGIGKSTVLHALDARAAAHGGVTIHGAGVTESPAFWPWVTAVRELVTLVPGLVDARSTSALATIDPALFPATDSPADPGDPALGRTRLYRAAIDLVGSARRAQPLTVVIDDVQALDGETAGLLSVAMPELTAQGVLFVLGFRRDDGADDGVTRRILERVPRDSLVRIALPNLSSDEVAETIATLTRRDPDPAVAEAVWARSRGNPLFVTELVRLLVSEDRLDPSGVYTALPAEVRDVLHRRLDRLPATTVSLLVVVALVGRATDVALLGRITDREEDDVVDGCEIAVLAGLLVDDPQAPGRYALSHDLVRQTLAETLTPAREVRLHARITRALDEAPSNSPDRVVEVARHALLAVPVIGAAAAVPLLVAAADDALSRLALGQAEQHLHDVMALAAQLTSADERARIERSTRSRLAMTHVYAKGPASLGEDALLAAGVLGSAPLTLDRADPTGWFAAMTAALAVGAYERMIVEAAGALTPDLPPTLEAMVRFELGLGHFELGHLSSAKRELEATRRLVSEGGDFGALIFALSGPAPQLLLGIIAHFEGDEQRADAMLAEATAMTGGDALGMVVELFGSAWLAAYRGDAEAAAAHAATCALIATDYPAYVAMSGMLAGWADALRGVEGGVLRFDEAFAGYTADGTLLHVPMFLVLRAEAHARAGDGVGARSLLSQARSVASVTGEDCLGPRLKQLALELDLAPA